MFYSIDEQFRIYVRAKKDAKALSHLELPFKIKTLGGKRKDVLIKEIKELENNLEYSLVLLGRRDPEIDLENPLVKVHRVPKANVRNVKLRDLKKELKIGLYRFITDVYFDGKSYKFGKKSNFILNLVDVGLWENGIILYYKDKDVYLSGTRVVKEINRLSGTLREIGEPNENIRFEKIVMNNISYIKKKIDEAIKFIKQFKDFDIVIPFSGGKDSSIVALLAKKAKVDFSLIHVDTGAEFKETQEYLDYFEKFIGKEVIKVKASVKEKFEKLGNEYLESRQCTIDKISTLYNYVGKNFENPVMLVGDRIVESEQRLFRPRIFRDEFLVAQPIKFWSFADEQMLAYLEGLRLNPLYEKGFYRIGCYFCPFLDNWEKFVLKK